MSKRFRRTPEEIAEGLTVEEAKKRRGLGDAVEVVTKATGIKTAVEHLFGEDCGCEERKEALNKFGRKVSDFFKRNVQFLTKEEYKYLDEYFKTSSARSMSKEQQTELLKIYNRVFKTKRELSSCTSCLKELRQTMNNLYNQYK